MEDVKDLLDWLAATPAATLYYREGIMHRHGRAPLSKPIPRGCRKADKDMDDMIIQVLVKNPGMELQWMGNNIPYWIVYMNSPRQIELPKGLFIGYEYGAICFKRADGKRVMLASITP